MVPHGAKYPAAISLDEWHVNVFDRPRAFSIEPVPLLSFPPPNLRFFPDVYTLLEMVIH